MNTRSEMGHQAVKQNVRALMTFLQSYAPYREMDEPHLALLVEHCRLQYFGDGDIVLEPGGEAIERLYIVKQGRIRGERDTNQDGEVDTTFEISEGECFPMAALVGERPTRTRHRAVGDTFCLVLSRQGFIKVFGLSDSFRDFCLRGVSSLLEQVTRRMQSRSMESLGANQSLDTPLEEFAVRSPVYCPPDTPIREAVTRMHDENVGSMIVVDSQRLPIGIFTLRDLRALIADAGTLDKAIADVMTPKPYALPGSATAFDAALIMAEHHFAHVCVVNGKGQVCGMVSERDLFSLQRVDLVHLGRTIATASSLKTLIELRIDVARLVEMMLAHGAAAGQILRIVTTLNDCTARRVIELNLKRNDPGVAFTWLTFGSEARHEQTLVTDQDNGILFLCPTGETEESVRQKLLPMARQINEDLAECGFSWCKGNIMASNPRLCLSIAEWRRWYASFIDTATPENLLKSSIFLDMRSIWGDDRAAIAMFEEVRARVANNLLFQKMLADNALHNRAPLNLFRGFVFARGGEKRTVDLKTQGLTPFVDAARIFAFANGIAAPSTLERIRGLAEAGAFDQKDAKAWTESYGLIQLMRMHNQQAQVLAGKAPNNRISTSELNQLDRRILREAFRQAQRLQQKLERTYSN